MDIIEELILELNGSNLCQSFKFWQRFEPIRNAPTSISIFQLGNGVKTTTAFLIYSFVFLMK